MALLDWTLAIMALSAAIVWWLLSVPGRLRILAALAVCMGVMGLAAVLFSRWQAAVSVAVALLALLALLLGRYFPGTTRRGAVYYWFTGLALSVSAVVAALMFYWFPVIQLPVPTGPYQVGMRDFRIVDEARRGVFPALDSDDQGRQLAVRVWYPTDDVSGSRRLNYFSGIEARSTARDMGNSTPLREFFFPYLKYCSTNSWLDAPLAQDLDNLPVTMFSHGMRGFRGQNTILHEDLASHGYIAYSVQHTYESSATVFPDGQVAPMDPELLDFVMEYRKKTRAEGIQQNLIDVITEPDIGKRRAAQLDRYELATSRRLVLFSAPLWLADRLFLYEALATGDVPERVADVVEAGNLEEVAHMGMSFGGSVASAICMVDKRCAAVVNIDGIDRHRLPFNRNMPAPMLLYSSDSDVTVSNIMRLKDKQAQGILTDFVHERHELVGLRNDLYRLTHLGITHYMLSDFGIFLARNGNPLAKTLFGDRDGLVLNELNKALIRNFLDKHLRGMENGFPVPDLRGQEGNLVWNDMSAVREWWVAEHPEDRVERVAFETAQGEWGVALYPERAPVATARFLELLGAGHLAGVTVSAGAISSRSGATVQAALFRGAGNSRHKLPGASSEGTEPRGIADGEDGAIPWEHGALAFKQPASAAAQGEYVVNLGADARLRSYDAPGDTPAGLIVFGRVFYGLRLLEVIQAASAGGAGAGAAGQRLVIERAYRVD